MRPTLSPGNLFKDKNLNSTIRYSAPDNSIFRLNRDSRLFLRLLEPC